MQQDKQYLQWFFCLKRNLSMISCLVKNRFQHILAAMFLFCALPLRAIPQNGSIQKSDKFFPWSPVWKSEETKVKCIGRYTSSEAEAPILLPLFFLFFQNTTQTYSHLASSNLSWRDFFNVYYKINVLSSTINREHWPVAQVTNQHETSIKTYCKGYTLSCARFCYYF